MPAHSTPGSGAIIRRALQQLETAQLVKKMPKKGRVITPKGIALLDKVAGQVAKVEADFAKKRELEIQVMTAEINKPVEGSEDLSIVIEEEKKAEPEEAKTQKPEAKKENTPKKETEAKKTTSASVEKAPVEKKTAEPTKEIKK